MGTTLSIAELLRIEALLSRLEADPGGTCQVAGCLHAPTTNHPTPPAAARSSLTILANSRGFQISPATRVRDARSVPLSRIADGACR